MNRPGLGAAIGGASQARYDDALTEAIAVYGRELCGRFKARR